MQYISMLLVVAATFGLCFLCDKGFRAAFRSSPQHQSGQAVRVNRRYAVAGIVLAALGAAALVNGIGSSKILLFGGILLIPTGAALIIYYVSFGVFYDSDGFLYSVFGKKSAAYSYSDIKGQQLYNAGGNILIELHMADGKTVSLQASMPGVYPFLDTAFDRWCSQTGRNPEDCAFHAPENTCYFPPVEDQ